MKQSTTGILGILVLTLNATLLADPPEPAPKTEPVPKTDPERPEAKPGRAASPRPSLGSLRTWDDGLYEISYYRATDRIYDQERSYTRVQMVNRQWMGWQSAAQANPGEEKVTPVLKLNISEEIPTENLNLRYMTTVYLSRFDLSLFKLVTSSQDWHGATFKHLRRDKNGLALRSFSYLNGEGDRFWRVVGDPIPHEGLFLVARDVAAVGEPRPVHLLQPMRTVHLVAPKSTAAKLVVGEVSEVTVPAGTFPARPVKLQWDGPATEFIVEAAPPYRLLRYGAGDARGELTKVERRLLSDPKSKSESPKPGETP